MCKHNTFFLNYELSGAYFFYAKQTFDSYIFIIGICCRSLLALLCLLSVGTARRGSLFFWIKSYYLPLKSLKTSCGNRRTFAKYHARFPRLIDPQPRKCDISLRKCKKKLFCSILHRIFVCTYNICFYYFPIC